MSFAALKNNRSNTQKMIEEINRLGGGSKKRTEDDRFWKPTSDKLGNGYAVIRFLPSRVEDNLTTPFVSFFDHGFQGPSGRWYIENSLTTIGKDDPVSEYNSKLWNSGSDANKEQARKQKRRLHYITNIYVVKDPANPANEGKVFLFKFGAKIFGKIKDAMSPPAGFEDDPIVPYDLWEGANFKLKIRKVEGYPNYDSSQFDSPSPLSEKESELEAIYNQIQPLSPFVSPDGKDADGNPYFKSYDELQAKLNKVLDLEENFASASAARKPALREPEPEQTYAKTERFEQKAEVEDDTPPWSTDEDEDTSSDLDFFKKLASE